jgi:hypothetical protein
MDKIHTHRYLNTPFTTICSTVKNAPGTWNSTKVSIYYDDLFDLKAGVHRTGKLIGEYIRNYSNYGANTFHPFQIDNEWYALYSAEYTATRVMRLYDDRIEDWCGEEAHANGFCPTEIYVPQYVHSRHTMNIQGKDDSYDIYYVDCDSEEKDFRAEIENSDFVDIHYCNFGFLCGCVWGDDTSWKIRYIDLSQIPNKILNITEKFGYWEMPNDLTLRECIRMDGWEPGHDWISLTRSETINLVTDERC